MSAGYSEEDILQRDERIEEIERETVRLRDRLDLAQKDGLGRLLVSASELQDALDAWRGLAEEQRKSVYEAIYHYVPQLSQVAARLLKAAAR